MTVIGLDCPQVMGIIMPLLINRYKMLFHNFIQILLAIFISVVHLTVLFLMLFVIEFTS